MKIIYILEPQEIPQSKPPINVCVPNPCGLYSICQDNNGVPACSCMPGYIGVPPNCHPECVINSDCSANLACIKQKCRDPCPGSCGFNAHCSVLNHIPICTCFEGYTGDSFTNCYPVPPGINLRSSLWYIFIKYRFATLISCFSWKTSCSWSMSSVSMRSKCSMQRWYLHLFTGIFGWPLQGMSSWMRHKWRMPS